MFSRRVSAGLAAAVMAFGVAAAGTAAAEAAPLHNIELHAVLHGSHAHPRATGMATFESSEHGRELDVHMSHLGDLVGRRLIVFVHGVRAGSMIVTRAGTAQLHRHHGVPRCRSGQRIGVRTRSGVLVASRIFRRHHH